MTAAAGSSAKMRSAWNSLRGSFAPQRGLPVWRAYCRRARAKTVPSLTTGSTSSAAARAASRRPRTPRRQPEGQGVALLGEAPRVLAQELAERAAARLEIKRWIGQGRGKRGMDGHDLDAPLHVRQDGQDGGLGGPAQQEPARAERGRSAGQGDGQRLGAAAVGADEDGSS